ncbi:hypothetical protein COCOBI_18-2340 [Coccomyxa sp. Obi]|nr:hypothetical protein COCOBI_18-2340 [Coccomyxa sp. Obi]
MKEMLPRVGAAVEAQAILAKEVAQEEFCRADQAARKAKQESRLAALATQEAQQKFRLATLAQREAKQEYRLATMAQQLAQLEVILADQEAQQEARRAALADWEAKYEASEAAMAGWKAQQDAQEAAMTEVEAQQEARVAAMANWRAQQEVLRATLAEWEGQQEYFRSLATPSMVSALCSARWSLAASGGSVVRTERPLGTRAGCKKVHQDLGTGSSPCADDGRARSNNDRLLWQRSDVAGGVGGCVQQNSTRAPCGKQIAPDVCAKLGDSGL